MRTIAERPRSRALRIALVGTGTGVGKTHVACALLSCWSRRAAAVGLKPVETGISPRGQARSAVSSGASDQERLIRAARMFHVKQRDPNRRQPNATEAPLRSLYAFADPISPHLAARQAGVRIDLGVIERWVRAHASAVTIIETAGGLFSPLGYGATNLELAQTLRADAVILVALDRLGVLHELTTTLALAAARGGPPLGLVLSTPAKKDASTGRNAAEIEALGIAHPIAVFPRASNHDVVTVEAARRVITWIESGGSSSTRAALP